MNISPSNTISARDVQRNYRKVVEKVQKNNQPVVVIRKNQPEVAIVSLDVLEEYRKLKANTVDVGPFASLWERNKDLIPEEVLREVTEEVDSVRKELYGKQSEFPRRR